MHDNSFLKLLVSIAIIIGFILLSQFLKKYAKSTQIKFNLPTSRYYLLKRIIFTINTIIALILLVIIWGVDIKDLWVSLTGIFAMVAIGLVATWSLLANALAGILLYFISPFSLDDYIEILPENISGKVLTINVFYTVLIDNDENCINVPNTLFYLKYIKVIRNKNAFSNNSGQNSSSKSPQCASQSYAQPKNAFSESPDAE